MTYDVSWSSLKIRVCHLVTGDEWNIDIVEKSKRWGVMLNGNGTGKSPCNTG